MQIDYFDIENKFEAQQMVLPWPMKFVAYNLRLDKVRIYYVVMPGATEQQGTFYCVKTEQELPETFPGQLLATVFPSDHTHPGLDKHDGDDATFIFFEVPVNRPKKPHAVEIKPLGGQKTKEGNGNNGGADNGAN